MRTQKTWTYALRLRSFALFQIILFRLQLTFFLSGNKTCQPLKEKVFFCEDPILMPLYLFSLERSFWKVEILLHIHKFLLNANTYKASKHKISRHNSISTKKKEVREWTVRNVGRKWKKFQNTKYGRVEIQIVKIHIGPLMDQRAFLADVDKIVGRVGSSSMNFFFLEDLQRATELNWGLVLSHV